MDNIIWIVLIAIAGFALWYYVWPKADVNKDGKVDSADAVAAVTKVADVNQDGKVDSADAVATVTKVADVNQDGKVNVADASEVITKVRKPRAKKNG